MDSTSPRIPDTEEGALPCEATAAAPPSPIKDTSSIKENPDSSSSLSFWAAHPAFDAVTPRGSSVVTEDLPSEGGAPLDRPPSVVSLFTESHPDDSYEYSECSAMDMPEITLSAMSIEPANVEDDDEEYEGGMSKAEFICEQLKKSELEMIKFKADNLLDDATKCNTGLSRTLTAVNREFLEFATDVLHEKMDERERDVRFISTAQTLNSSFEWPSHLNSSGSYESSYESRSSSGYYYYSSSSSSEDEAEIHSCDALDVSAPPSPTPEVLPMDEAPGDDQVFLSLQTKIKEMQIQACRAEELAEKAKAQATLAWVAAMEAKRAAEEARRLHGEAEEEIADRLGRPYKEPQDPQHLTINEPTLEIPEVLHRSSTTPRVTEPCDLDAFFAASENQFRRVKSLPSKSLF